MWTTADVKQMYRSSAVRRATLTVLTVALVGTIADCSASGALGPPGPLALGTWGGDSAGMIVSDTAMHLHIGCTFGDVSGRVAVDANGQFDITGNYTLHAYPITVGPTVPARFVGHLDGTTAIVTAIIDDTTEHKTVTHGPIVVTLGKDPRLGPCPICRRPIVTRGQT